MSENPTFDRIEGYFCREEDREHKCDEVVVSFRTRSKGILQVAHDGKGLVLFSDEPDMNMFTSKDQEYIEQVAAIAWRIVFDTTAAKERFRKV